MKNYKFTSLFVCTLFMGIMAVVVAVSYLRKSHQTGIDPSRIKSLRQIVRKEGRP